MNDYAIFAFWKALDSTFIWNTIAPDGYACLIHNVLLHGSNGYFREINWRVIQIVFGYMQGNRHLQDILNFQM